MVTARVRRVTQGTMELGINLQHLLVNLFYMEQEIIRTGEDTYQVWVPNTKTISELEAEKQLRIDEKNKTIEALDTIIQGIQNEIDAIRAMPILGD